MALAAVECVVAAVSDPSPVNNPVWQRLESLRPSLPRHIHIQRRDYQRERWYLLQDKSNGRFHRLSPSAWRLVSAMDGRNSLAQILALAADPQFYEAAEEIPTRDDLIHLLQYLHVADLLVCDLPPNTQELFARREQKKQQRWVRLLMNPLTWNIPLGNPDKLLDKLMPVARLLATRTMGIIWLLVVGYALLQAGNHWTQLTHGHLDRLLAPANLLLLWLTYPFFKILHELGHGLFTKVWGGQVNDCGVVFVVGTPLPYVDASAATGFYAKRQRLMVSAAGMAVEIFLAALALLLWVQLSGGFLRDFLYNIILIGGVSTLFFNGNPLMRFDGYHLLTDALDLPNLATRANQQVSYLLRRYAYGITGIFSPASSAREAWLLAGYSIAAFIYRIFMLFFIILLVANYFPALGLVIGCWLIFFQLVWPGLKALQFLLRDKQLASQRKRALGVTGAASVLVVIFLAAVPLPHSTSAEAVLWLPDEARVKVGASGEVVALLVSDGSTVAAGEELVRLQNPALVAQLAVQQAKLREYDARYQQAWVEDRAQAQMFEQDIAAIKAEMALLQERAANLIVRSPSAGIFRITRPYYLPGSYLHQGDELAIIEKPGAVRVRAALLQDEVGLVRQATATATTWVSVRFASDPANLLAADAVQDAPIASDQLPSPVLGTQGGGRIAVDATQASGTKVKEKVFLLDLALRDFEQSGHFGERAYIKFHHPAEPLMVRWYRNLQQVFIRHFS